MYSKVKKDMENVVNLVVYINTIKHKKNPVIQSISGFLTWSHLGSNQGPPDYESGALTN